MALHRAETPCPTAQTGSAHKRAALEPQCSYFFFNISQTAGVKLTLLGREVREDAVQRAAVCQVVERSGAVRYEQHLVASACEKVSATRTERIKNQEQQEQKKTKQQQQP